MNPKPRSKYVLSCTVHYCGYDKLITDHLSKEHVCIERPCNCGCGADIVCSCKGCGQWCCYDSSNIFPDTNSGNGGWYTYCQKCCIMKIVKNYESMAAYESMSHHTSKITDISEEMK